MNAYKVFGYSYFDGHYVFCGNIEATSERAAKLKARKIFDQSGIGFYKDFLVTETAA